MSADGPVSGSGAQRKTTAVKPESATSTATKALPSTGGAAGSSQKALSSMAGASKPVTSGGQKPVTSGTQKPATGGAQKPPSSSYQKPASPYPKPNVGAHRPQGGAKPATGSTVGGVRNAKPNAGSSASKATSDGKVSVSAASRPKPAGARAGGATKPQSKGGDILGIGGNYGDATKTRPQSGNASKPQGGKGGPPAKPSAGDPLGMGQDLGNMGVGGKK